MFYELPFNFIKPPIEHVLVIQTASDNLSPAQAQSNVENRAKQVINAIKLRQMSRLASFVHPTKGLRFSPYSYIDPQTDSLFTAAQLKNLHSSRRRYIWGTFDGSGEQIRLTFANYYKRFIYDRDYINAPVISYNKIAKQGNSTNNLSEIYPKSVFVEYHFPGSKKYSGLDWRSLRLVFENKAGAWFLVGIVHDQWTI